jgi:pilus assembly protein Flp/PilA
MQRLFKRFHRDERGATATEYALLIVFVALAIAVGAQTLGNGLNSLFSQIGSKLSAIQVPPLQPPSSPSGGTQ